MKITSPWAAGLLGAAGIAITAAVVREAASGRRLAYALTCRGLDGMYAHVLKRDAASLRSHLRRNPDDVLARHLLHHAEAELIHRAQERSSTRKSWRRVGS